MFTSAAVSCSSPEAISSSAAWRSMSDESAPPRELLGHRLVALEDEEPRDAAVVLLGQRANLSSADDADEPRRLEHLQVMPDRPLRHLERGGELGRARRALAQQRDDARASVLGERAELLGILNDEDVVELVVGRNGR